MDAGSEDMRRFVSGWDKIRPEEADPEGYNLPSDRSSSIT